MTTDSIDKAAASFREAITKAIVPLQTTRVISVDDFVRLEKAAAELVALLKGHELVSKSLLNEFLVSAQVLRNEAPFCGSDRSRIESVAQKIEYYLSLILKDEAPEQRIPGVPRVI
jgi:hypothetical protein